jgi:excisionase family DNA binding protein
MAGTRKGQTMTDKQLLSRRECEHRYGPHKTTFYKLLHSGALRAVKIGTRTFVRRDDAEAWAKDLPHYEPRGQT